MVDLCVCLLVVLGAAPLVRRAVRGGAGRPLTSAQRRLWVFVTLLCAAGSQSALAGLGIVERWTVALPAGLVVAWLLACRHMVRPRHARPRRQAPRRASDARRASPATLALVAASVLAAWIAVNPLGEGPTDATASAAAGPAAAGPVAPALAAVVRGAERAGTVTATRGAIVLVGDHAQLTANTGETSASGAVALGVDDSDLAAGDSTPAAAGRASSSTSASLRRRPAGVAARTSRPAAERWAAHENGSLADLTKAGTKGRHGTALSGFEDHSVSVVGDDQIVTYDDSNVFIDRLGQINANTGDTDSSGLNAVDVAGSTVRAGNSGDSEGVEQEESPAEELAEEAASPATSYDENRLATRRMAPPAAGDPDSADENEGDGAAVEPGRGQAFGTVTDEGTSAATGNNSFVVGADGVDDVSIRSHGRNDIVTYDDSNVTIGGTGKVNAQIGDSDTGGAVVMGIQDSDTRAGCEGDLCYSATPTVQMVLDLLRASGISLSPRQWNKLVEHAGSEPPPSARRR